MAITGLPTIGNDTITITPTGGSVDGLAGTDTLVLNFSTLGSDIRYFSIGGGWMRYTDDVRTTVDFLNFERFNITGGAGDDLLGGGALNDRLVGGLGNDQIESGIGADTIFGGGGSDRWVVDYSATAGNIGLTLSSVAVATVAGSGAQIHGIEAISMSTGAGTDALNTEAYRGDDSVSTAGGDDLVALGRGIDSANGGDDIDTLQMDWSAVTDPMAAITFSGIGGEWYRYANGIDRLDYYGFEKFRLTGGAGSDELRGSALNDTLTGNAGNDWLRSGAGVDQVSGGDGVDTWEVDASGRVGPTVVNLETQTTNYNATLSGIERIQFSGGNGVDRVTALAGVYNDVINAGDGNDVVQTGRGVDSTDGGLGTLDKLIMDWSGITDPRHGITNYGIGGGWVRYISASGDRLDMVGYETYALTGGAGDDALNGSTLNDTLIGNGGDDTLNSGSGDGTVTGGDGNDLWIADISAQGVARFDAALSQTTAQVTTLGLSVTTIERLSLNTGNGADVISTAGYALNDNIFTSGGNDTLNGGTGIDTLNGGDGTDLMVLNYAEATTSIRSFGIGGGWTRTTTEDGTASVDWLGMERFTMTGGLGNDGLSGGAFSDTLSGGLGNDVLNGYRGPDVINGGGGIDTYIGDYSNLAVGVSFALSALGAGTIVGTGTKLALIENINLTTGAGADVINLSKASGSDTLSTGAGDDVINLGRGVSESVDAGLGNNTVTLDASLSTGGLRMYGIGGDWHRIQATNGSYTADIRYATKFNFLGSASGDRIYGFELGDTLNGRGGTDFLNGAHGNDTLTGGAGADVFVFNDLWNAGRDTITDRQAGDLIRLEGIGLTGSLVGGAGASLLAGEVSLSVAGGISTLHVGLDGVAGGDLHIDLTGASVLANYQIVGSDILLV